MYQEEFFENENDTWLRNRLIIGFVILMIVIITFIIVALHESSTIYLEGAAKSITLIDSEKASKLGDLYIKLCMDFENKIKDVEKSHASRLNKRGDKIYYGVNGSENDDMLVNNDYVNGVQNIEYIKGLDNERADGDGNFTDMLAFLSSILDADIDEYTDTDLTEMFTELFWLTHTFSGESTELYPCVHGCSYVKYYCGDIRCIGEIGGNTVGFYKSDLYMGRDKEYGLMYNPFVIYKPYDYYELLEYAGDEKINRTTYEYENVEVSFKQSGDKTIENHTIKTFIDTVYCADNEIYGLTEYTDFCTVHTHGKTSFNKTTKTIGGCIDGVECYHGKTVKKYRDEEDTEGHLVDWYLGTDNKECDNNIVEDARCTHECEEEECTHTHANEELQDTGYYVCMGHTHYACPGHYIITCFGHCNLNLKIKIMYYKEMIQMLKTSFAK